ncbi:hypothetical protein SASPL_144255 [Salvia splendens]|uniref:GOLD domain-containing protein n=1 Tax=Salvia splendens TaxID=180675 RepID=A0A8X8WPP0_SALSN|nr:hypothetical protein SASPL_144255 [Salvia splendens]
MNFPIQRKGFLLLLISVLWLRADSIRFDLESGRTKCISEDIKTNSMTVGKYHIVNPNEGHPLPDSHKVTVRVTSAYGNSHHYSDQVTEGHFAFQAVEEGDYMACFFAADHKPSTAITVDFDWKSGVAAKDWTSVVRKGSVEQSDMMKGLWADNLGVVANCGCVCGCGGGLKCSREVGSTTEGGTTSNVVDAIAAKGNGLEATAEFAAACSSTEFFLALLGGLACSLMETELKKMLDTVQTIHDEMYYLREREEEMQLLNKATNNKMFWFSFLSILVCLSVTGIQLWHLKSFFEKKKLI